MKKWIYSILFCLFTAGALSGCDDKPHGKKDDSAEEPSKALKRVGKKKIERMNDTLSNEPVYDNR